MTDSKYNKKNKEQGFPKEAVLELVTADNGCLELRDVQDKDNPLVIIEFSDKIKDILDGDVHIVGQHMIHSAIQLMVNKQMDTWHANVYDEEPQYYS